MKTLKSTINKKYCMAIIAILLVELFGFFAHIYLTNRNDGYAELINLSGRQRMLSQRITLGLYQLEDTSINQKDADDIQQEVLNNISLFENSHQILTARAQNETFTVDKNIVHFYRSSGLDDDVIRFITLARNIASGHQTEQLADFTSYAKGPMLNKLNQAVSEFESISNQLIDWQFRVEIIILVLSVIILSLILIIILLPLRDTIVSKQKELDKTIDQLKQEGSYKSLFLANMSHELRTPLNGILGVSALLKSKSIDEEMLEYMDIIDTSGNTLLGTIDNILDLTKLEMNEMQFEQSSFDPQHLLEIIFHTFKYYPNANPVQIIRNIDPLPQYLIGDPQKITQIINNLMSNAMKFTQRGEIVLSASYEAQMLTVKVKDTGVGIDEGKLDLIFEPFKQADASTRREFGGTGLGLAISKQMADTMGGSLSAHSDSNQGTTFTLQIPLQETNQAPTQNDNASDPEAFEQRYKGLVLIAEDNQINYLVISKMLQKLGLEARHAVDGVQAVEIARAIDFDLILMDYHMPNMNGIEAIEHLSQSLHRVPPIVMLTADISDSSKKLAFKVGVAEFIEKPIQATRLRQVIGKYLSKAS